MSRIVPAEEFDLIERIISEYPEGIGISALEKALISHLPNINRRTLQRRLKKLRDDRRIITEGESIALVYKPAPDFTNIESTLPPLNGNLAASDYTPVSKEGTIIGDLIRQPLTQRKPIGYQRSFLEEYEPGATFYLSESLRSQLHEIGGMQTGKRPAGTYAREILNRLLIDLSWSSSRLEGNTYSRLDTEKLITFGQAAEGKDLQETQMILNHKAAIVHLSQPARHPVRKPASGRQRIRSSSPQASGYFRFSFSSTGHASGPGRVFPFAAPESRSNSGSV